MTDCGFSNCPSLYPTVKGRPGVNTTRGLDEIKVKSRLLDIFAKTGQVLTGREIARRLGEHPVTISRHIKGRRNNPTVQLGIARILDLELSQITKEKAP